MLDLSQIINNVFAGNAYDVLSTLFPDNIIDCVITSPPYWRLRDYYYDNQIGQEKDYTEYINNLCKVFGEVKRVLKDEGTCWVNLGDTYANKTLLCIPFQFALRMIDMGWLLRNVIIWHKTNCMPSSAQDRFCNDFEYLFFFTKSNKYYFNMQYEELADSTKKRLNYDYLSSKLDGVGAMSLNGMRNYKKKYLENKIKGRYKRCVWSISTSNFRGQHYAVFPDELVEIPILAGCPEGGIVLDPFVGSGTTCVVANKLFRKCVGIDVNKEYVAQTKERLEHVKNLFAI